MAQVTQHRLIPTKKFEGITVGEILDFWWERHAKHRNSGFEYLMPRLDKFRPIKARNLMPEMIQDFLDDALHSYKHLPKRLILLQASFGEALGW